MSAEIYESEALYVTRFVGPAEDDDEQPIEDRARWQFTPPLGADYAVLNRRQVRALAICLLHDAWPRRR